MSPKLHALLTFLVGLAVALGVGLYWLKRSNDPLKVVAKWIATAVLVLGILYLITTKNPFALFVMVGFGAAIALIWASEVGALISLPITNAITGGDTAPEIKAAYSKAHARRKQGKPSDAITEIHAQLEQFPDDFEGLVLLAEIQTEDLRDLQSAVTTLERIVQTPERHPKQIVFALNSMADWHLKYGLDPDSARLALQRITEMFPDTEQAYQASQRIAHLASREMLTARHEERRIALPARAAPATVPSAPSGAPLPPEDDPEVAAGHYIKRLAEHPHDQEAREQLALLYGRQMKRLDLARQQFEFLLATPHVPSRDVVRWLNALAGLEMELEGDEPAARATLQRIIDLFPDSAAASQARQRIDRLGTERPAQRRIAVKLGTYERDLGLKKRPH
ncbi:MAG: tetratricopeptide repeat protein [Verrucomicrobiota bacterium]